MPKQEEEKIAILLVFFQLRRLVFDQSSPVQPFAESWGGPLSVTEEKAGAGQTEETLVSNIEFKVYFIEEGQQHDN